MYIEDIFLAIEMNQHYKSPDLLKRSSDVVLEDDVPEVRIEQSPEAFNSVTQLAPSSPSSLLIGPEDALPFGHPGFTPLHISK